MERLKDYFIDILIAFDQLINTLLGGYPDETISANCYRKKDDFWGWWLAYRFVNLLFFWQEDHCKIAYESEEYNLHLPREYR